MNNLSPSGVFQRFTFQFKSFNMQNLPASTTEQATVSNLNENNAKAIAEKENLPPYPQIDAVFSINSSIENSTDSANKSSNMQNLPVSTAEETQLKKKNVSARNENDTSSDLRKLLILPVSTAEKTQLKKVSARNENDTSSDLRKLLNLPVSTAEETQSKKKNVSARNENDSSSDRRKLTNKKIAQNNTRRFYWRCKYCHYEAYADNRAFEHASNYVHNFSNFTTLNMRREFLLYCVEEIEKHPLFKLPNEAAMINIEQRNSMETICNDLFKVLYSIIIIRYGGRQEDCPLNLSLYNSLLKKINAIQFTYENNTVRFLCPFCAYDNEHLFYVRMHILKHSKLLSTYNCPLCILGFSDMDSLSSHGLKYHQINISNLNILNAIVGKKLTENSGHAPFKPLYPNLSKLRHMFLINHI